MFGSIELFRKITADRSKATVLVGRGIQAVDGLVAQPMPSVDQGTSQTIDRR